MNELILTAVALPGTTFLAFAIVWLFGWTPSERVISRITDVTFWTAFGAIAAYSFLTPGPHYVQAGQWFQQGEYKFPISFYLDGISLTLMAMTAALTGVIGAFSRTYLHREPGYFRFFLLLNLFGFGALLAFAAGTFDLIVAGWELVGLSSVLLIGFFYERTGPVTSAIRVFGTYRSADIGLLVGVFLLDHYRHSSQITALRNHELPAESATLIGLAFLLAAMGKAAQVPFSGWLPRAMEGPTPSSAIFYGAISVHMGAYLLLRARPLLADAPLALGAVVAIGLVTAVHGVIVSRVASDAKSSLAYAAVTQLGLIFAEIGMGWTELAVVHIVGHSIVRTLQFLRAPSMMYEYHHIQAAAGADKREVVSFENLLPAGGRARLYWYGLDRGHWDRCLDTFIVNPLHRLAWWMTDEPEKEEQVRRRHEFIGETDV